jgi:hypothetical protein
MTTKIQDNNAQKTYYYVFQNGASEMKRCETLNEVVSYCESLIEDDSDSTFSDTKFNSNGFSDLSDYDIVVIKGKTLKAKHSISIEE